MTTIKLENALININKVIYNPGNSNPMPIGIVSEKSISVDASITVGNITFSTYKNYSLSDEEAASTTLVGVDQLGIDKFKKDVLL